MWVMVLVLAAMLAIIILMLLAGTKVKIHGNSIRLGLRTYSAEDIMRHRFLVRVCHKSPAEYDTELNVFIPRTRYPSRKKAWVVELEVFTADGEYIRKHLLKKPTEYAAEKLATELKHCLAPQLIPHTNEGGSI